MTAGRGSAKTTLSKPWISYLESDVVWMPSNAIHNLHSEYFTWLVWSGGRNSRIKDTTNEKVTLQCCGGSLASHSVLTIVLWNCSIQKGEKIWNATTRHPKWWFIILWWKCLTLLLHCTNGRNQGCALVRRQGWTLPLYFPNNSLTVRWREAMEEETWVFAFTKMMYARVDVFVLTISRECIDVFLPWIMPGLKICKIYSKYCRVKGYATKGWDSNWMRTCCCRWMEWDFF